MKEDKKRDARLPVLHNKIAEQVDRVGCAKTGPGDAQLSPAIVQRAAGLQSKDDSVYTLIV